MFRLKSLQEGRKRDDVQSGVDDVEVDEGEGVDTVYCFA